MIVSEFGIGHHYWHEEGQTVICVPPKCGCSAIKYALLMASNPHLGSLFAQDMSRVHSYSHLVMAKTPSQVLKSSRRIFVTRNPLKRLISGFISKFVMAPENIIIKSICDISETPFDLMSFRTYVDTICNMPDSYLDPHFKSQESFLALPLEQYEFLSLDFGDQKKYSDFLENIHSGSSEAYLDLNEKHENIRAGTSVNYNFPVTPGQFSDFPVKKVRYLRENGSKISKVSFIYDGLDAIVRKRFGFDFELNERSG